MKDFIPVNEPLLDGNEKKYLQECIETGWVSSEGPFVDRFEKSFSKSCERTFGVAVTNGTAALDVAFEALGIEEGDEVILPTFTIISCMHQILRSKAIPVFIDCDPKTWNIDVKKIEASITKKTKAILVVHIYGLPVDIDPVLKLCKQNNLRLIEDAAECIGQTYNGKPCGSFGDISTVSFYSNKHVTCGEGGMLLTNDPALAEKCKSLRNLCFNNKRRFVHNHLGWNLRMTNLQAAVGLAQLERLSFFLSKKREIGKKYHDLLSKNKFLSLPLEKTTYSTNCYWVFGVILKKEVHFDAHEFIEKMASSKIGCRPFFYPLHRQPVLAEYFDKNFGHFPVADHLSKRGLYLPSGLGISESQIEQVVEAIDRNLN